MISENRNNQPKEEEVITPAQKALSMAKLAMDQVFDGIEKSTSENSKPSDKSERREVSDFSEIRTVL